MVNHERLLLQHLSLQAQSLISSLQLFDQLLQKRLFACPSMQLHVISLHDALFSCCVQNRKIISIHDCLFGVNQQLSSANSRSSFDATNSYANYIHECLHVQGTQTNSQANVGSFSAVQPRITISIFDCLFHHDFLHIKGQVKNLQSLLRDEYGTQSDSTELPTDKHSTRQERFVNEESSHAQEPLHVLQVETMSEAQDSSLCLPRANCAPVAHDPRLCVLPLETLSEIHQPQVEWQTEAGVRSTEQLQTSHLDFRSEEQLQTGHFDFRSAKHLQTSHLDFRSAKQLQTCHLDFSSAEQLQTSHCDFRSAEQLQASHSDVETVSRDFCTLSNMHEFHNVSLTETTSEAQDSLLCVPETKIEAEAPDLRLCVLQPETLQTETMTEAQDSLLCVPQTDIGPEAHDPGSCLSQSEMLSLSEIHQPQVDWQTEAESETPNAQGSDSDVETVSRDSCSLSRRHEVQNVSQTETTSEVQDSLLCVPEPEALDPRLCVLRSETLSEMSQLQVVPQTETMSETLDPLLVSPATTGPMSYDSCLCDWHSETFKMDVFQNVLQTENMSVAQDTLLCVPQTAIWHEAHDPGLRDSHTRSLSDASTPTSDAFWKRICFTSAPECSPVTVSGCSCWLSGGSSCSYCSLKDLQSLRDEYGTQSDSTALPTDKHKARQERFENAAQALFVPVPCSDCEDWKECETHDSMRGSPQAIQAGAPDLVKSELNPPSARLGGEAPDTVGSELVNRFGPCLFFLTVIEVCNVSLLCTQHFMSFHPILSVRRHLCLAGASLSKVDVSAHISMVYCQHARTSCYVCNSCKMKYGTQTTAASCDCSARRQSELYKGLLAESFNYMLSDNVVEVCVLKPFLHISEFKALCCASSCCFHYVQPCLRILRLQAHAGHTGNEATLHCNLEIVAVQNGAAYRCTHCHSLYQTQVPTLVCSCMMCGMCDKVLPTYSEYFNTSTICTCDQVV